MAEQVNTSFTIVKSGFRSQHSCNKLGVSVTSTLRAQREAGGSLGLADLQPSREKGEPQTQRETLPQRKNEGCHRGGHLVPSSGFPLHTQF